MTVSFVIPTYNEKGNIIKLINKIINTVRKTTYRYQIIVVDDNSPDETGAIGRKYFYNNKRVEIYIRKMDKGFASAIYYGIKKSKGEIIIVMDADFSHDPKLIPKMLLEIKNHDVIIGSRYIKNGGGENKERFLLSKIYNLYLHYLLRINITDFLFGFFCVKKEFIVKNNLLTKNVFSGFGDYFIRLAYGINKSGGTFIEIPAYYKNRIYGESKSNLFKMLITYTLTSLQVHFKGFQ